MNITKNKCQEKIKIQLMTHSPAWLAQIYSASDHKKSALQSIQNIYYNLASQNKIIDENEYKKQIESCLTPTFPLPTFQLSQLLEDTYHALCICQDEDLVYCHQSFWKHVQKEIHATKKNHFKDIFKEKKSQYIFKDWLYELDIDMHHIQETYILLDIIKDIRQNINFSNHLDLKILLICIEADAYEDLKETEKCDTLYQQSIEQYPLSNQLHLNHSLTVLERHTNFIEKTLFQDHFLTLYKNLA